MGESCSFGLPYVLFVFFLLIVILVISHFGFEGGSLGLIASVPVHCLSFTIFAIGARLMKYKAFFSSFPQNAKASKSLWSNYGIRIQFYHRLLFLFYQYLHQLWDILGLINQKIPKHLK